MSELFQNAGMKVKNVKNRKIETGHTVAAAVFASVLVLVVMALVPCVISYLSPKGGVENQAAAGQYGDMFGAANALFSGLAFVGLVATLFMQMDELQISRRATDQQTLLASKTARFTVLPALIQNQAAHLLGAYIEQLQVGPFREGQRGFPSATADWLEQLMAGV